MTRRPLVLALALAAAVAPLANVHAQSRLVPGADGYPVVDYVGIANWAFSPAPRQVTTPTVAATVAGNATGADRQYATDYPLNAVGGAPVLVVLPGAVLPAGTLRSFQTWNQATAGQAPFPSAGNTFNAYVLRPTGTANQYAVAFDSGTLTVPPLSGTASELATYPVAPFTTQAGDVIAFYGQGVPLDVGTGTDVLSYPAPAAPATGSTITLGVDAGFPIYPQARDYALAATVDVVTGSTTTLVGGMRKFVDTLPGLGATAANNLGQYIPVAVPDTATYPGSDYYELEVGEYEEKMHSDLPATRLRGYRQTNTADATVSQFHYLGPVIVAQKDRPVRIKFTNRLPAGAAGDLFVPVDETVMGAGTGPKYADGTNCDNAVTPNTCSKYPQNRATLHLHGGHQPWISDGTPHQWITPAGEITPYKTGVSVFDVPDMPAGGDGSQTFYWTNQQSARLMFYHDHSYGITRLNVYVGEAAGYVLQDPVEQELVTRGLIPGAADTIPLVIQDRTFVDAEAILSTDPTWRWGTGAPEVRAQGYAPGVAVPAPKTGDLWYPHVYVPAQNPYDLSGANAFGRWHYGPWFWPPTTGITHGPIPNPYYDPDPASSTYAPFQPPEMPGVPHPSAPGEAFMDVAVVNGTAYPSVTVDPKSYRLRILNAANDRFWNLQLYVAADKTSPTAAGTTGAVLCDGVNAVAPADCTEVKMVPAAAGPVNTTAFPTWPVDGREGGVPDPTTQGPSFIQFGSEGGILPAPAVVPNQPVVWNANPTTFNFGNVSSHALLVAPAERAEVVVDFSAYAGKTLILYNDAPAAFPAADNRYDYYTGAPDLQDTGGAPSPLAGYGPNTRTIMQIVVRAAAPAAPFDLAALQAAFRSTPGTRDGAFARAQDPVIVAQGDIAGRGAGLSAYDTAYGKAPGSQFPFAFPYWGISRIQDTSVAFSSVNGDLVGTLPLVNGQLTNAKPMEAKAIQDEMGEVYDPDYGRMSARIGLELPFTNALNQTFVVQTFVDAPTEIIHAVPLAVPANDVNDAQIWKITHNGVDTHPIHFHLFEVQLLNRVGWDGQIRLPDANELGWKDTIRVSPLEDTIVALRMVAPKLPFGVPDSLRPMSPATPLGSPMGLTLIDPHTGQPLVPAPTNQIVNYAWEYVWHCHILAHEEMDMMRPVTVMVDRVPPPAPILTAAPAGTGVALTWIDPTPAADPATAGNPANEVGFRIERATGVDGVFTAIGRALSNATSFGDPAANAATGYFEYRVVAYNAAGEVASNVVSVGTRPPVPAAPTGLSAAIASTSRINLTWTDASTNETSFRVFRSTNGGAFVQIGTINRSAAQAAAAGGTVSFANSGGAFAPAAGNTYVYYVRGWNAAGGSPRSNLVTVQFRAPPAPSGLAGVAVAIPGNATQDAATLTWTDNAAFETGFQIQRSTRANFTSPSSFTVGANATTFTQNVSRANDFSYRVRAVNGPFVSAWSNAVRVTTP